MIKVDRALQEVWDWKDAIYKESKDKSVHGVASTIRKRAAALRNSRRFNEKKSTVSPNRH